MSKSPSPSGAGLRAELTSIGRRFYDRNWVLGTSGNFSAVLSSRPLRLVITASGTHKGRLTRRQFIDVDERPRPMTKSTAARPSAETALHMEIVRVRAAAAVLHTHSVWSTILSERHAKAGGLLLHGYEMLKGLSGVTTHEHREWLPIVPNEQDMKRLSQTVRELLTNDRAAHGFLLQGHGLYTWGNSVTEAERHVEVLEFLLETSARASQPWQL